MKKFSYFTGALSTLLLGATALTAQPCSSNWNNNCCDWSFCDGKIIAGADWLYWQTEQTNMDFFSVSTETSTGTAPVVTTSDTSTLSLDRNYESGFRVYLGYELPCNGWEAAVIYSNMPFHTTLSSPVLLADDTLISDAFFEDTVDFTPASFASAKWDGNINNIDLDIAHTIAFGECFRLRPHIGFRAMWMDQKYRYNLDNELLTEDTQFVDVGSISEKLKGYGVEGGLFANWNIGCGFSLVGHVGGSLLYSQIKVSRSELYTTTDDAVVLTTSTFTDSHTFNIGTPSLDYFVGFEYSSSFCETALSAYVGWEQHVFFDVNQIFNNNNSGNLYTQGLTLGVNAAF